MISISNEFLFIAFMFAALVFCVVAFIVHAVYRRLGLTNRKLDATLKTKQELIGKLNASMAKEERLQKSIDRLIIRRTELLDCMNAAQSDEERVECIKKLMHE
jgi:hypothetical protein